MTFIEADIRGVFVIDPRPFEDERGSFTTVFCRREFEARGVDPTVAQVNVTFSRRRGTLRGMHFQRPPHAQAKLVRCSAGSLYDVVIDLRPDSATHGRWFAITLSAENRKMLYVPEGFAHGFQTLEDATEVVYNTSDLYAPELSDGVRWNDPAFGIVWPDVEERIIIARDRDYPDYVPPDGIRMGSCR